MQTEQIVYICTFGGHQESHTWQRPHKRFGASTNSSALSPEQYLIRTTAPWSSQFQSWQDPSVLSREPHLLLPVCTASSFSLLELLIPSMGELCCCFLHPLLPCRLICPNTLPLCPLFSCSSGLPPIPLKFLPLHSLHLFNPLKTFLPELSHCPQALGHLQLSQSCHSRSFRCICAYGLG